VPFDESCELQLCALRWWRRCCCCCCCGLAPFGGCHAWQLCALLLRLLLLLLPLLWLTLPFLIRRFTRLLASIGHARFFVDSLLKAERN